MENNNQPQNDNKIVNDSRQKQNRFKSKAAWAAASALLLFIFKTYGFLVPIGLTEESYKELTTLIFAVLTAFGIFNDPTNSSNF